MTDTFQYQRHEFSLIVAISLDEIKGKMSKSLININNPIHPTIVNGNRHDRYIKLSNCYWMYTWVINCYQINQKNTNKYKDGI